MRNTARRSAAPAILALTLALTACAQGSATRTDEPAASGAPVTVRYMNFSANGGHEEDLDAIKAAFEAANPDVKVQIETTPYDDYFTKLQTAVAGGTAGDAFELNYENFVTYSSNGSLAPLKNVETASYKPSLLEAFSADGTQYGLPESFSNVVLFYNKDLFAKAGVDEPTADWTWADEQAAAEKLTDEKAGVWGDYQPISFFEYYKAVAQAGGEFLNADKTQAAFDSDAGRAGCRVARRQVGDHDADRGRRRGHARLRLQAVQGRQARDVAHRDLDVLGHGRRALRVGHRRRAR